MNSKTLEMIERLRNLGISLDDALALRRIAMTLHRWHELECGTDTGAIERDQKWAIERAAWDRKDKKRWWTGSAWDVRAKRRTYDDYERHQIEATKYEVGLQIRYVGFPVDGAWRETGEKPWWSNSGEFAGYAPDRETGAKRRLAKIMARYPSLLPYIQGDPRGAALYILRPGDVPEGCSAESYYSRGVAVYR